MNNSDNSSYSLSGCHGNHAIEADETCDAVVSFTDIELKTIATPKGFVRFDNEDCPTNSIDLAFVEGFSK